MHYFGLLASLAVIVLAEHRTTAPPGALVVKQNDTGVYSTIQAAVDALSNTTTTAQSIFINPGTYNEQVFVPRLSGPLSIFGYTTDDTTYTENAVTIVGNGSQRTFPNNDLTATLRVWTTNFKLYNVNVANNFGVGSQALALSANAGEQGYYACKFTGYQDTILAQRGYQLYAKSYINGATDFIFGQDGQAWFEKCDIRVLAAARGWITASGRRTNDSSAIYVINKSTVAAEEGHDVPTGAYFLGRPWSQYARVIFQFTYMTDVINPAGWAIWNIGDERIGSVEFGEYRNIGEGSVGARASFSEWLTEPVLITDVLGSGYENASWVDMSYMV